MMDAVDATVTTDTSQDPRTNRVQDSLQLWKDVVSNKLLGTVNIVLFLNKVRNPRVKGVSTKT